ncbi:Ptm1 protein [Saccharomycopsis crataegensis]|uniref:Ptm1 protein n=1 Tax=Saccharomycopsis crataegensis TaxID=43959 RepID=A0AAV5QV63_9ASCO|nr:Ptm1 protein [Saccharomycopsis crataegensis]
MLFFKGLSALLTIGVVVSQLETITNKDTQVCSGMYNRKDWAGNVQPYISVNLLSFDGKKMDLNNPSDQPDDIDLSLVIFEYKDIDYLGSTYTYDNDLSSATASGKKYICDEAAIQNNLCSTSSLGEFIISPEAKNHSSSELLTFNLKQFGRYNTTYPLKNTGYYCISTYSTSHKDYEVIANFRNSFGNLNASEIPKLPLYGGLTILYLVTFFYYFYNYYKYRTNVTNLQKNLNFFTIFLIFETILVWFYYELKNNHNPYTTVVVADTGVKIWKLNSQAFVKFYMLFISILNSIKLTFSFYLLLLISLGMGVVYPNLPKKTLIKCKVFACVQFVVSVGYIVSNYLNNPENPNALMLISLVPLSLSLTVFYYLILTALTQTTNYLKAQKQTIKLNIYRKLFLTIFISLVVLFLGLVASSFVYIGMSTTELIEQHWKSRFLVLDFWPSLVYYGVYACILFIWRPTYNSYLLIVSSQVGTDEDAEMNTNNEFELNNLGNEFNINDDDDNDSFVGHFVAEDGPSDNRNDEETQIENKKSSKPSNDESGNAFKIDDDDEDDSDGEGKENPFSDSNKLIEDKK